MAFLSPSDWSLLSPFLSPLEMGTSRFVGLGDLILLVSRVASTVRLQARMRYKREEEKEADEKVRKKRGT